MKKLAVLLAFFCFLPIGCATLDLVSNNLSTTTEYIIDIDKVSPVGKGTIEKKVFEDQVIKVTWDLSVDMDRMGFLIKNKTDKTVKIDWNNAAYVDPAGISHKVIHEGVKLINKGESQLPSVIVQDSLITDSLTPVDFIRFNSEKTFLRDVGWETLAVFHQYSHDDLKGKTFKILLPLIKDNVPQDYLFTFKIYEITTKL